jgi:hypothetical protein
MKSCKCNNEHVAQTEKHDIYKFGIGNQITLYINGIYLIFLATLGLWVYSASNRNEYWKHKKKMFLGSKVRPV